MNNYKKALLFAAVLHTGSVAQADIDTEACKITPVITGSNTTWMTSLAVLDPLLSFTYQQLIAQPNAPHEDRLYYREWGYDSNAENRAKCNNTYTAAYCTAELKAANAIIHKYFNPNLNGTLGSGVFQGNWEHLTSVQCQDPLTTETDEGGNADQTTVSAGGLVQSMTSAAASLGEAGAHVADTALFNPNGVLEEKAVEAFNAKESGKAQTAKKETLSEAKKRKIASSGSGSGNLSGAPGLRSGSTDSNTEVTVTNNEPKIDDQAGKFGQAGAGAGKGSAATDGGWASNSGAASAGGSELKFGGVTPSNVNPNGTEDPANYFALTGIDEDLFKKVEKRYRETSNHWARVDLTRDSSSQKDRALAAAKDPEYRKK